jgi:hypothetical protein
MANIDSAALPWITALAPVVSAFIGGIFAGVVSIGVKHFLDKKAEERKLERESKSLREPLLGEIIVLIDEIKRFEKRANDYIENLKSLPERNNNQDGWWVGAAKYDLGFFGYIGTPFYSAHVGRIGSISRNPSLKRKVVEFYGRLEKLKLELRQAIGSSNPKVFNKRVGDFQEGCSDLLKNALDLDVSLQHANEVPEERDAVAKMRE